MITFRGVPIHVCDKAPKNKPYIIDSKLSAICPFCGEPFKEDNKTDDSRIR